MNTTDKKAALIANVRATCTTFEARARELRLIHAASEQELDWMYEALMEAEWEALQDSAEASYEEQVASSYASRGQANLY